MKRINSSYKLVEFLSGRRSGVDTVVNVATIEFSDKNIGNFLVRSAFQTSNQAVEKLSGPKRSIKITDHFTCT